MPPDSDTAPMQEVRRLVLRLVSLKQNWPSEPSLPALSPRMINGLLDYNKAVKRGTPMLRVIFAAICGLLLWVSAAIPIPGSLAIVVLVTIYYVYVTRASQEYRCAACALTQTKDARVLPALIQATRHEWGRQSEIYAGIFSLLDHVTEEHAGLLNDAAQLRLWVIGIEGSALAIRYGDEVALRVIRALAAVGNRTTLARMRRLVLYYEQFPSEHLVITTARELIPMMEARLQRQQAPETLLRATDMPTSLSETLLRAAHATTPEPPQQLLRASSGEEREL